MQTALKDQIAKAIDLAHAAYAVTDDALDPAQAAADAVADDGAQMQRQCAQALRLFDAYKALEEIATAVKADATAAAERAKEMMLDAGIDKIGVTVEGERRTFATKQVLYASIACEDQTDVERVIDLLRASGAADLVSQAPVHAQRLSSWLKERREAVAAEREAKIAALPDAEQAAARDADRAASAHDGDPEKRARAWAHVYNIPIALARLLRGADPQIKPALRRG